MWADILQKLEPSTSTAHTADLDDFYNNNDDDGYSVDPSDFAELDDDIDDRNSSWAD
jgi:hypothetical protein